MNRTQIEGKIKSLKSKRLQLLEEHEWDRYSPLVLKQEKEILDEIESLDKQLKK